MTDPPDTPTPRTDAAVFPHAAHYVTAQFARELESDLAAARERIAALEQDVPPPVPSAATRTPDLP